MTYMSGELEENWELERRVRERIAELYRSNILLKQEIQAYQQAQAKLQQQFEQLQQANVELEQRVADLTAELTQNKRIEESLRQSENEFRSLSESSPVGIFRTNLLGGYTYTNSRCQAICGFTFAEALGEGWLQFVYPEDRARAKIFTQWTLAVSANEAYTSEVRYLHKDGTIRHCQVRTVPIFASTGELSGYVGSIEDISASQAIVQMKNEFISIVSHELRTPLTSLRGSLGLLASGVYDKKPEKAQRMLQVAADSAARLVRLVSDILDLERLESGKVTLVQQSFDAANLMLQSVEIMQANAEQNNITLCVTPLNVKVWAAPDAIIQTITNLLSNAIKFSEPDSTVWLNALVQQRDAIAPGQGESPHPPMNNASTLNLFNSPPTPYPLSVGLTSPLSSSYVLFSVKDTGRGIPVDKLEKIFAQFQQVDASDSREKGGTGLGLAICRSIIRQHGGQIWAESVLGEGSTFYFTLPLPPDEKTTN